MGLERDAEMPTVWVDSGRRVAVTVRGSAAIRFVDGFTTAAVATLRPGTGAEGFFADAKGHVLALAAILRTADGVWIDAPPDGGCALAEHLERYHIREPLEITDESAGVENLLVFGPVAAAVLTAVLGGDVPREPWGHVRGVIAGVPVAVVAMADADAHSFLVQVPPPGRTNVVAALEARGVTRGEADLPERLRIEQGWPGPTDILPKTLPQELGRDARAISFTKGCYLGQETVARLDALGHVNRRLVGLWSAHPLVAGAVVRSGTDVLGTITSACRSPRGGGWLGLAILPLKACAAGVALAVEGREVRRVELPPPSVAAADDSGPPSRRGGEVVFEASRFRVVRIEEPGAVRVRDVVEHPGSVVIVPVVSPREVCLVEVARIAVGRTLLELPAGTLDRVESPADAAARELAEETGYRAGRVTSLGGLWMSPGILRERMHLFLAEQLVPGPQALEPGERITVRVVSWEEAVAMCHDGRIEDAKTVAGLLLARAHLTGHSVPASTRS